MLNVAVIFSTLQGCIVPWYMYTQCALLTASLCFRRRIGNSFGLID